MLNQTPPQHNFQPQKKSGISKVGMVFIIIGVIIVGLLIAGTLLLLSTVKDVKNMLEPTSRVTAYVPTEKDRQALEKKVTALEKIKEQGGEYTFIVTPSDVNTYISSKETGKAENMEPRIRFDIQGNILSGMISVPIKDEETGKVQYFNGEAKFTAELIGGQLDVRLKDVLIKGKKPPFLISFIIDQFKKVNLVEDVNNNPKHATIKERLQYCKNLAIKDGKASVTLKFPKPSEEQQQKKVTNEQ
jgi:hypothetical protein